MGPFPSPPSWPTIGSLLQAAGPSLPLTWPPGPPPLCGELQTRALTQPPPGPLTSPWRLHSQRASQTQNLPSPFLPCACFPPAPAGLPGQAFPWPWLPDPGAPSLRSPQPLAPPAQGAGVGDFPAAPWTPLPIQSSRGRSPFLWEGSHVSAFLLVALSSYFLIRLCEGLFSSSILCVCVCVCTPLPV